MRCECLEDVSIFTNEISGIKRLLSSNISRDLNIGNWSSYSNYRNICSNNSYYEKLVEEIEFCISIINRKLLKK
jgi:hypothetical protein